jgi:lysophospholipase L1-like esterase
MNKKIEYLIIITLLSICPLSAKDFSDLVLIKAGNGGNNTVQGLARFERDVLDQNPDTVILFFGMNDSINDRASISLDQYEGNLRTMITLSKENNISPYLVTINPVAAAPLYERHPDKIQSFYIYRGGANAIIDTYNQRIRKVAQTTGTPLVDFAKVAKKHNQKFPKDPVVCADGVHLSRTGKKILGDAIASSLYESKTKPVKVVCMGDSLTKLGYDTEVLLALDRQRFHEYTTSVPSEKAHKDTQPPALLFDKNYKSISLDSIEYRGDVEVSIDLKKVTDIKRVEVVYFSGANYTLSDISLFGRVNSDKLKLIQTLPIVQKKNRVAYKAKFELDQELQFLMIKCKRAEKSSRVLISEIIIK